MTYEELLRVLNEKSEKAFADFQRKLVFTKSEILGVRTPVLREIAKSLCESDEIFSFPDDVYEVTFIKLAVASRLPYEKLLPRLDDLVKSIDNWATCDTFRPTCLKKRKEEFLPQIEKYFSWRTEFSERYALVTLLAYYVEEKYLPLIREYLERANVELYYVRMAAAWLTAEVLIKYYPSGVEILKEEILPPKAHNKAIQKARESRRLTNEQKACLETLKRKNKVNE